MNCFKKVVLFLKVIVCLLAQQRFGKIKIGFIPKNKQYQEQQRMYLKRKHANSVFCVIGYKVDLYFHDYKLAIEVHEFNHCDGNIDKETK